MALNPRIPNSVRRLPFNELIYVKTNIGGYFFDAFLKVDHTSELTLTEHPVQSGASISDHAYLQPKKLNFDIGMSDVAKSLYQDQFSGGWSRSVTAYQVLKDLQSQRVPVQILTRLGLYKNMIVTMITAPDDYNTLNGLRVTVELTELLVAVVSTVRVSERPHVSNSTQKGNVQPVQPNQSILKQWFSSMNGGK